MLQIFFLNIYKSNYNYKKNKLDTSRSQLKKERKGVVTGSLLVNSFHNCIAKIHFLVARCSFGLGTEVPELYIHSARCQTSPSIYIRWVSTQGLSGLEE